LNNNIYFFSEDLEFTLNNQEKYRKWIKLIAEKEGKIIGDLNYIFCSDTYLHDINVQYLKHDTFTDIITFPYEEGETISGDIFISIERIRENAQSYNSTFETELNRVMAHGLLHLAGYNDKKESDKNLMRLKEDEAISIFP
jgi:rRNA maturation RNase YbeY